MKVKSIKEAWGHASEIFPTDYIKDECASSSAGYDIYRSTVKGMNAWISDLGDRLEINLESGRTVNIWIEQEPQFKEYQIADALSVISTAIYKIDDNITLKFQEATGIDKAVSQLYSAYAKIAKILKDQYPDSKLYDMNNLKDAE